MSSFSVKKALLLPQAKHPISNPKPKSNRHLDKTREFASSQEPTPSSISTKAAANEASVSFEFFSKNNLFFDDFEDYEQQENIRKSEEISRDAEEKRACEHMKRGLAEAMSKGYIKEKDIDEYANFSVVYRGGDEAQNNPLNRITYKVLNTISCVALKNIKFETVSKRMCQFLKQTIQTDTSNLAVRFSSLSIIRKLVSIPLDRQSQNPISQSALAYRSVESTDADDEPTTSSARSQ